jgi:hypothetical protein
MTLSAVSTKPRALMLASFELAAHGRLIEIVGLNETDPSGTVLSLDDGSIRAGIESRENGRFQIIGWLQAGGFDVRLLKRFPIVVRADERPIAGV